MPKDALVFGEIPVPSKLKKHEVLVKVQAAALNPIGYKFMTVLPNWLARRPVVAEYDLAGIVVDPNGSNFAKGDQVFGSIMTDLQFKTRQGALTQYTRLPASRVYPRPNNITPTQAAGLALAPLTAYQALFKLGKLQPGQHIFINGGSTAVGSSAIQMAKAIGCTVTATASAKNETFVRSLGVDEFIDYTQGPVHLTLESEPPRVKYSIILEAVGNIDLPLFTHSPAYLEPSGIFISTLPQPANKSEIRSWLNYVFQAMIRPRWLGGTNRKYSIVSVDINYDDLGQVAKMVSEGKFKPIIDSVYSYENVLDAYDRMMSKRATGKIVVKVDPTVE